MKLTILKVAVGFVAGIGFTLGLGATLVAASPPDYPPVPICNSTTNWTGNSDFVCETTTDTPAPPEVTTPPPVPADPPTPDRTLPATGSNLNLGRIAGIIVGVGLALFGASRVRLFQQRNLDNKEII